MPASRNARLLRSKRLRIGRRAANEADDSELAAGGGGLGDGLPDRRSDLGCRIRMRAVAEDDVEQDDRGFGILRLERNPLVAEPMIDHGMRPPASEHVVAEIDERVRAALPHIVERLGASPTGVLE